MAKGRRSVKNSLPLVDLGLSLRMKNIICLLAFLSCLVSCKRHHRTHHTETTIVVEKEVPIDIAAPAFTFTTCIDGIIGPFWYGPAECVVPVEILAQAPEGPTVLSFGGPLNFYLAFDYALVEITTLEAMGLLGSIADKGHWAKKGGKIKLKKDHLHVGKTRVPEKDDDED